MQEKAIAFPTNSKLMHRARERLVRLTQARGSGRSAQCLSAVTPDQVRVIEPANRFSGYTDCRFLTHDELTLRAGQAPAPLRTSCSRQRGSLGEHATYLDPLRPSP